MPLTGKAKGVTMPATALIAIALGSCGGETDVRPPKAAMPASTSPGAAFAGSGELASRDQPETSGGITFTPIARYSGRVSVAQNGGFLAVAVGGTDGLELRVSKDGRSVPTPAKGAGVIPVWASIHVGADGHGFPTVVYPRCSTAALSSCDLYYWSSLSHREQAITGLSEPGRAEIEGAAGPTLAVGLVVTDAKATAEDHRLSRVGLQGELVVPRPGGSPQTIARTASTEVTLGDGMIGELQGRCGERRRLLDANGHETFHYQSACGFNEGRDAVGASIENGHFSFADAQHNGGMVVYDHRLQAGERAVSKASVPFDGKGWAAIDTTSGYIVSGYSCTGQWENDNDARQGCVLGKVTGLRHRAAR